ncbi:hypothetical protein DBV15_01570 [Temnothorax longispinosus]|uniref:Uncharacterized protein n=1 Tax=Temnothorax longispinosus TaxID=300112 RepID=A0A4S2KT21_9HYME|nr:hypothetical protein DBV15_01570 [Temnothorax longispinosus]
MEVLILFDDVLIYHVVQIVQKSDESDIGPRQSTADKRLQIVLASKTALFRHVTGDSYRLMDSLSIDLEHRNKGECDNDSVGAPEVNEDVFLSLSTFSFCRCNLAYFLSPGNFATEFLILLDDVLIHHVVQVVQKSDESKIGPRQSTDKITTILLHLSVQTLQIIRHRLFGSFKFLFFNLFVTLIVETSDI